MRKPAPQHLTGSATVVRGALWNIAGRVAPLLVALAATPFLVTALGLARWGIFALALSLVGLFGMFDFGIGRALTRVVAADLGDETRAAAQTSRTVMTGLALLGGLGVAGGIAAAIGVRAYTEGFLDLPAALEREVMLALYVLCAAAPLVLLNAALWGVLAAHQRFAAANLVNLPILALYYLGPLAALQLWDSLVAAMLVLVACRAAMGWAYWRLCLRAMPSLRDARPDFGAAGPLLRQGGWITVSGVLWPITLHLDRFIIAARLSAEAAAYYATPFDLVIRLAVLGQAVVASAFPAMATALVAEPAAVGRLFRHSVLAIAGLLLPCCLLCILFAEALLTLWLGAAFADAAAPAMRWLAAGVLLFALDSVATALIDGAGQSRRNALLAVADLAFYVPALLLLLDGMGIAGAALAWTLRALLTGAVRLALAVSVHPLLRADLHALLPLIAACVAALGGALLSAQFDTAWRAALVVLLPLPCAVLAWRHALSAAERAVLAAGVASRVGLR